MRVICVLLFCSLFFIVGCANTPTNSQGSKINLSNNVSSTYDTFAKCLTSKNFTFYGTFWCSHCLDEKNLFGSSFQYINYVECSTPDKHITSECVNDNISAFPTFIFADGSRLMGTTDFSVLAAKTGCTLPGNNSVVSIIDKKPVGLVISSDQLPSGFVLTSQSFTDSSIQSFFDNSDHSADVNSIAIDINTLNTLPDISLLAQLCANGTIIDAPIIGDDAVACKVHTYIDYYYYNYYYRNILVGIMIFTDTLNNDEAINYLSNIAKTQLSEITNITTNTTVQTIIFSAPETINVNVGEDINYSFCDPEPEYPTSPCGPMPETTNPTGGNPPYHFQLGSGTGFPPFGITLSKDGILHGTVDSKSNPGSYEIEVCAIDLNGNAVCKTVTIIVSAPISTPNAASIEFISKSCVNEGWVNGNGGKTDKASLTFKLTGPIGAEANGGPCKQTPDCGTWHATNDNTCIRQEGDPESTTATYNYCTVDENRPNYNRGWIYVEGQGEQMSEYYTC